MHPTWHPSVQFLPAGMSFSVCVHCIIRKKLQTFIWGIQQFHVFSIEVFIFFQSYRAVLVSPYAGYFFSLEIESIVGHHQSVLWKRRSSILKQEETENGASNCCFQVSRLTVFLNSRDFLLSSIGRSKLIFPIYNWNIVAGNLIKFTRLKIN